ncbi:MAG: bifunctional rhamnulose-1-phosphate aldolase/short-chain dehydrogenase [Chloroflexota bacterium]
MSAEVRQLPVERDRLVFPIQPPANRWDSGHARGLAALDLLAYRSNLLGADRSVANWGGGNTSCKTVGDDFRGIAVRVLWVKGSGSDLGSIRPDQFTGVRLDDLGPLDGRPAMSDEDLVRYYEHAALSPGQPRASIETPLHSMLPFANIDHTHPDAIIALCAIPDGPELARRLWDGRAIWVPYERPGFGLGRSIARAVAENPEAKLVLMAKHGLVTWGETAEECYAASIAIIGRAAEAIAGQADGRRVFAAARELPGCEGEDLAAWLPALRGAVSARQFMVLRLDASERARAFAGRPDLAAIAGAGPACPDHLIHTKPWPLVVEPAADMPAALRQGVADFEDRYRAYVGRHASGEEARDPAPRVVLLPGTGIVTTGPDARQAELAAALYERAIAVLSATAGLRGFDPLTEGETFGVEYWPMELFKLKALPAAGELSGRVAVVTGGASGIGRAIVRRLAQAGAHVAIADLNLAAAEEVAAALRGAHGVGRALAIGADVTDEASVRRAFRDVVLAFGGLDILVSNAGLSTSSPVDETSLDDWKLNLEVLATGYFLVAREAFRVLRAQGRGGSIVFIGSKNGLVAGRNAAAYSAAKAAELHLARCLAEEGGPAGIRVNSVNPDAVLRDSGIWSSGWREQRARTYGIAPAELEEHYRERTALKVSIFAEDVAEAVLYFASDRSSKSTGNILNVDGGVAAAYPR